MTCSDPTRPDTPDRQLATHADAIMNISKGSRNVVFAESSREPL